MQLRQISMAASIKQTFFSPIFQLGGISKYLMTGPKRSIEGLGEIKLTVSLGASLLLIALGILRNRLPHCSVICSTCMT